MKKNKGFTLIELLVVIAIIGILAAIVLVSLSGARNSAKDARIQADMSQLRVAATTYNMDKGNYNELLLSETNPTSLLSDIVTQGGAYSYAEDGADYCVVVKLNSATFWCVDSSLNSSAETTDPAGCSAAAGPHCTG